MTSLGYISVTSDDMVTESYDTGEEVEGSGEIISYNVGNT